MAVGGTFENVSFKTGRAGILEHLELKEWFASLLAAPRMNRCAMTRPPSRPEIKARSVNVER